MERVETLSLDQLCIDTIRMLSIDMVQKANSGHPGLPLGAAPMAYVLWMQFLRHNPSNPQWYNRDRFVLSAGHGSALLYSMLHLTGYDLPMEQLKQFRQWGSKTPGHPEKNLTPGVDITTGPLGQGFANGVGMAIAEAYLAARYNRPHCKVVDHYTYGILSDGDIMEGIGAEAASIAGHLKLGKLIYLYDCNHITLSASTQLALTDDHAKRFESYGWHTQTVKDGNDLAAIAKAIEAARQEIDRPSLIIVRTIIGFGSPHKQDTFEAHGSPLGEEEVKLTKQNLGWPSDRSFYVPEDAGKYFKRSLQKGKEEEAEWNRQLGAYAENYPDLAEEFHLLRSAKLPKGWDENIPQFPADAKGISTRVASGKVMQAIWPNLPGFIGGSADLNPSTFTELKNGGSFQHSGTEGGTRKAQSPAGGVMQGATFFMASENMPWAPYRMG